MVDYIHVVMHDVLHYVLIESVHTFPEFHLVYSYIYGNTLLYWLGITDGSTYLLPYVAVCVDGRFPVVLSHQGLIELYSEFLKDWKKQQIHKNK